MKVIETNLKFTGSLSNRNKTDMIILHHAEAKKCSVEDIHRWHLEFGWSGFGYHFLVRKDGSIYRGRPELTIGAHCSGKNSTSIGICAEGSYMVESMPEVQKASIIELISYLKEKYNVSKIFGHREVGSSNCPGTNYPLEEIRKSNIISTWDNSVKNKLGKVTANVLNVRYTPDGKVIGQLTKGDTVKLWRKEGDWYHIVSPIAGYKQAYVYSDYVSV